MIPSTTSSEYNPTSQKNFNTALGYLGKVKSAYQDKPEVYESFLDLMRDYKKENIDLLGVLSRLSTLFNDYPSLIQDFEAFLPQDHQIEITGTKLIEDIPGTHTYMLNHRDIISDSGEIIRVWVFSKL
ncbi:Transcriptional regulatory protein sin3 [Tulasnella sp. 418]|nr:Transcriptional regulatory protein sin3 [Tulasnella sp. 418]